MFSYRWQQVWGLITSVCKSDTSPTLFYLRTSWFESGLSSSMANCPLEGSISRLQQWLHGARLRMSIIRQGRAACPSAALQACAPFTPQVAPDWRWGSPCMCCLVLEVTRRGPEGWGPHLRAEVLPWGQQAVLPLGRALLEVEGRASSGGPSCPSRSSGICVSRAELRRVAVPGAGHRALWWALTPRSLFDTRLF